VRLQPQPLLLLQQQQQQQKQQERHVPAVCTAMTPVTVICRVPTYWNVPTTCVGWWKHYGPCHSAAAAVVFVIGLIGRQRALRRLPMNVER